jgi:hypothetical protein
MFCRRKDRKKMIQCKENGIFFEKIIRCVFNACQIKLSEFNTSAVGVPGLRKQKNGGKKACCWHEISKTVI